MRGPQSVARVERLAGLGGEHVAGIGPDSGRLDPVLQLVLALGLEQGDRGVQQWDDPAGSPGLGLGGDQRSVDPRQSANDPRRPSYQVNIGLAQSERLTLRKPVMAIRVTTRA
jgi:hypothetical protein